MENWNAHAGQFGSTHKAPFFSSSTSGGAGGREGEEGRGQGEGEEERGRAQLPAAGEPGQSDASPAQSSHHAGELPLPALQTGKGCRPITRRSSPHVFSEIVDFAAHNQPMVSCGFPTRSQMVKHWLFNPKPVKLSPTPCTFIFLCFSSHCFDLV